MAASMQFSWVLQHDHTDDDAVGAKFLPYMLQVQFPIMLSYILPQTGDIQCKLVKSNSTHIPYTWRYPMQVS
jgi:hypothetical protein